VQPQSACHDEQWHFLLLLLLLLLLLHTSGASCQLACANLLATTTHRVCFAAPQKLVKSAAENGNRAVFDLIMSAKSIQEDPEELEEAVGAALKVAAGENLCKPSMSLRW
jgi:hypothetical protein